MKYSRFLIIVSLVFLVAPISASADDVATIVIRNGGTVAFSGTTTLPSTGAPVVAITPNSGTTSAVSIPARSVLAVINLLDAATSDFDITDLQYFSSFNSFLINCVLIPASSASPACFSWQYIVNGATPFVGVDDTTLQNGDSAILYFGNPRDVILSASSVNTGQSFTVTGRVYNPADNTFGPATGVTIGVTQSNPADPFNPIEIATSTVDSSGNATFSLSTSGTYAVGIKEDFYFPTVSIIAATPPPATALASGGGGGVLARTQFDTSLALSYITGHQRADGSFESALISDWSAVAFAGGGAGDAKEKLARYFASTTPELLSITDYERHAMALEALGINPYSGAGKDYISPILNAFDQTQIGEKEMVNDDVFALIPLMHAGYSGGDEIIQKVAVFILTKQLPNGSWEESVDMTAAAIQALSVLNSLPNVTSALGTAKSYLRKKQQLSGGFGHIGQENTFSTSWVMQAIRATGESPGAWPESGISPQDYLSSLQASDGGVLGTDRDSQTRLWATAYAIPAIQGRTWDSLLESFPKPEYKTVINTEKTHLDASSTPTAQTISSSDNSSAPAIEDTGASKTIAYKPGKKSNGVVLAPALPPNLNQTASVAIADQEITEKTNSSITEFFTRLWTSITSFLQGFF